MTTSFATHNHTARVDTHRVQLMDLDADEYGAPEGGRLPEAEPAKPPAAGPLYWAVVALSLVFACYLIGVHVLASWGPEISKALASWGQQ